jgi:hypothetical protein
MMIGQSRLLNKVTAVFRMPLMLQRRQVFFGIKCG